MPSPHLHTHGDTGFDAPSRLSSSVSLLRKALPCIRWLSLFLSGETDTGLDTVRDDGEQGDNADVLHNGA